ncbi:MAG: outer membrane protein assembly factor BamA [Bacteroidetes bacterium]|jgi:outer membrane protein insertion porin family|nr:outer membrane protein assembly factor BamA [Bacteroidota bacterium]
MTFLKYAVFFFFLVIGNMTNAQIISSESSTAEPIDWSKPKEYTLGPIEVEAKETDKNVIRLLSGLTSGDKIQIPGDKMSEAIKNLWKQGLFEDVQIYLTKIIADQAFLKIVVVEKPKLSKFSFRGKVKKNDADEIRGKIRLVREKVVTDYTLGYIKNIVKDFYVNKGFYNATVDITTEPDKAAKTPHVIVYINVNKGRKVRIKNLNINGNTVVADWKLRRKMSDSKPFRLYTFWNSGKYLEDNLEKDLPSIIAKYNSKGYRDARIKKDTVYFVKKNRVNIDIEIEEGNKFYFGNIKWFGNAKYRSGQLDTILNIKKGEVFDQSYLDQKLFMNPTGYDISSLYMDDGYLFFNVSPQEVNVHNDTIDLDIHMYEGKQATINRVTVMGNTKTNDHVIYREIRTRPGQLFRRSDIIRTQRELSQLGYFDPEKLGVTPTPNPADGTVDIEYKVEEKPSDQVELSGGWGGGRIVGTLGLSFNNFSMKNIFKPESWSPLPTGDGQKFSIRAQTNGIYYQSYNISFTEPWLGGKKPNSLSVSGFFSMFNTTGAKKYVNDDEGNKIRNPNRSTMKIIGGSVGFGKRLKKPDDFFSIYTEASYNYYELENYPYFILANGYANDFNGKINITRNSVDAPIFPKNGSNFSILGQFTPPYSLFNGKNYETATAAEKFKFIEYQKYKFTAEWFTQLTNKRAGEGKEARNLVLRTKIGYGILGMYNSKVGVSPFERYYMGGSGLSGYQNFVAREIIALRGYTDNSLSSTSGDPLCARYTMELRYPISLNPQATIFVLGFAEAGNTWARYKDFNPFQVKRSAGFGLRVFLPMFGLLGLDYGWGFDNIPGNTGSGNGQGQFHFTLGAQLGEL